MPTTRHKKEKRPAAAAPATTRAPFDWAGWGVAVGSALAGAAAFEPLNFRLLLPLAPLGCFWAMRRATTPWRAFARAWLFGQVFYFCVLQWLTTISNYAPVPFLAAGAIVLLGAYIGLYTGLCAYITRRWFSPFDWRGQYCVFAGLWIFQEWFRSLGRLACPLGFLPHAWAEWTPAIQIAARLGELGVTFEILVCGFIIGMLAELGVRAANFKKIGGPLLRREDLAIFSAILIIFLFFNSGYDHIRAAKKQDAASKDVLRVALAQPNVSQRDKLHSYMRLEDTYEADMYMRAMSEKLTANQISQVTQKAKPGWDLLLMPESAFTQEDFARNEPLRARVAGIAKSTGADIFFGANRSLGPRIEDGIYNSAWMVRADGTYWPDAYDKVRLVPFGEDMPYFDLIPGLSSLTGIGEFNIGGAPTIFETHGKKFGALICFESMFAAEARERVRRGAQFLAVITNDGWYGTSAGVAYHHHISYLRAVETGRYVLRCANTGISSIITPWGEDAATLPLGAKGIIEGAIHPRDAMTPFVRFGNAWLWLVALGMGAALVKAKRIERARRAPDANEIAHDA